MKLSAIIFGAALAAVANAASVVELQYNSTDCSGAVDKSSA